MKRDISLEEISDGNLYGLNDLVKAGCHDCQGCFSCCQGMGESIVLDPLDICRMTEHLGKSFDELVSGGRIGLHVEEGIILPNLTMAGPEERCSFLNEEGRCSIHPYRPGICRIFPLGRYYEEYGFRYFLQVHECRIEHKTKVKVRKWIATPDVKTNELFILEWHGFLLNMQELAAKLKGDQRMNSLNMDVLNQFFRHPYGKEESFYDEFTRRLEAGKLYLEQFSSGI